MTLDDILRKYPGAEPFKMGDNARLCDDLIALVRVGKKTATCAKLADFQNGLFATPQSGRIDILTRWDDTPALALQTVELRLTPFDEVEAAFALAEGENASLQGWRDDHQRYFARTTGFDPKMELVCERFRVVEDFGGAAA